MGDTGESLAQPHDALIVSGAQAEGQQSVNLVWVQDGSIVKGVDL